MQTGFPVERVIYQDADILVVNKPSGLLSIPDGYKLSEANLTALLSDQFGRVWVVHRIDKDTSGLVLFARNANAHQELNRQFRERLVHKAYLAIVAPVPTWENLVVKLPLLVNAGRSHLTKVDTQQGKMAETVFTVCEKRTDACLLECLPRTGYRHQIRAHLYAQGIGILGDELYNPKELTPIQAQAPRLMLQAQALRFTHPTTNTPAAFSLPMDPELQICWNNLTPTAQK
jgi:tRNA pseudouridine32 synthase/23S rRNA pseudouridine746 synthase